MPRHLSTLCLLALGLAWPAVSSSANTPSSDSSVTVERSVDFAGKPPFKRRLVRVEDVAESVVRTQAAVRATGVAVRGRPPFRRQLTVPQTERNDIVFARLEETAASDQRQRRRGPPGKRAPFVRN